MTCPNDRLSHKVKSCLHVKDPKHFSSIRPQFIPIYFVVHVKSKVNDQDRYGTSLSMHRMCSGKAKLRNPFLSLAITLTLKEPHHFISMNVQSWHARDGSWFQSAVKMELIHVLYERVGGILLECKMLSSMEEQLMSHCDWYVNGMPREGQLLSLCIQRNGHMQATHTLTHTDTRTRRHSSQHTIQLN